MSQVTIYGEKSGQVLLGSLRSPHKMEIKVSGWDLIWRLWEESTASFPDVVNRSWLLAEMELMSLPSCWLSSRVQLVPRATLRSFHAVFFLLAKQNLLCVTSSSYLRSVFLFCNHIKQSHCVWRIPVVSNGLPQIISLPLGRLIDYLNYIDMSTF